MLGSIPHGPTFLQFCCQVDRTSCQYIQLNSCGFRYFSCLTRICHRLKPLQDLFLSKAEQPMAHVYSPSSPIRSCSILSMDGQIISASEVEKSYNQSLFSIPAMETQQQIANNLLPFHVFKRSLLHTA